MNALDVLRVLRRHPFVLVLLLILSVAGAGLVYVKLPVNYQSTASEILLPSKFVVDPNTGKKSPVNPFRLTGDNPSVIAASTLASSANGSQFQNNLTKKGVVSAASIAVSPSGGGVVIDVAATDKAAATTARDLKTILQALSDQLFQAQLQAGGAATESQFYGLQVINPPAAPAQVTSGRFKTSVISGVLGLIVTLIIILIYDAQVRRRRPRGRRRTDGSGRTRPNPDPEHEATDSRPADRPAARADDARARREPVQRGGAVTVPQRDAIGPRAR